MALFKLHEMELQMKHRLLVMNGQRITQINQDGVWRNIKVDKAGPLKPGIYNLYIAQKVDKAKRYDSMVVYADGNNVYQQVGKSIVMHARSDFDRVPEVGLPKCISYDDHGNAVVTTGAISPRQKRSD